MARSWTAAASQGQEGLGWRGEKTCPTCQLNKEGGGLIIDALIKLCAECEHCDMPDLVIKLLTNYNNV